MAKTVTMKDIGKQMGISTVTVSNALTDKTGVSDELRARIKEEAKKMGYSYHLPMKPTILNLHYTVGVLLSRRFVKDDIDAFYSKLQQNIAQKLIPYNFFTQLEIVEVEEEKKGKIPNLILLNRVDGIIVLGEMEPSYLDMLKRKDLPLLYFDFQGDRENDDSINSDSLHGVYLLTSHLLEMGHTEIGFVGSVTTTSNILERYLGYSKALLEEGIFPKKEWLLEDRDQEGEYLDIELPQIMPTAFVCNCDQVAYLFTNKLKQQGYRVPEDISIVGFDNYIYSTICEPPLTTYAIDVNAMAESAAELIIQKIRKEDYNKGVRTIHGNIVYRDSVTRRV